MKIKCLVARTGALFPLLAILVYATSAAAQKPDPVREAGTHFRRGVELYSETNYAGALVEFKRAYELAPSAAALYDLGEAQYQLQDYAAALRSFRRFLSDYGPNENHRAEVEANVQVLATRVGRVNVTTVPVGADITVDDESVGKTPLNEPILVSVGRRKVTASMPGLAPVSRYVEVAAGDEVAAALALAPPIASVSPLAPEPRAWSEGTPRSTLRWVGWIATGALAAGAGTLGILAIREDDDLHQARSGLTTSATLTKDANATARFAILADSLGAAAIVAGGISLYLTLSARPKTQETASRAGASTHLTVGPTSARLDMTF
jgi:tetratricopeptide (TPR) repeat protein